MAAVLLNETHGIFGMDLMTMFMLMNSPDSPMNACEFDGPYDLAEYEYDIQKIIDTYTFIAGIMERVMT